MKALRIVSIITIMILLVPCFGDTEKKTEYLSLYTSDVLRKPLDEINPIDYRVTFLTTYNDNVDLYWYQERFNGVYRKEYRLMLQNKLYRGLYLAGMTSVSPEYEVWGVDLKWLVDKDGWKTYIGATGIWDPKYGAMALLEETKRMDFNLFIIPSHLYINIRTMTDFSKFYHEERVIAKMDIGLPMSFKLNKYMKLGVSLMILSKDYGYYRWQHEIMLSADIVI